MSSDELLLDYEVGFDRKKLVRALFIIHERKVENAKAKLSREPASSAERCANQSRGSVSGFILSIVENTNHSLRYRGARRAARQAARGLLSSAQGPSLRVSESVLAL